MDATTIFTNAPDTFVDNTKREIKTTWSNETGDVIVRLTTYHNKDSKSYIHSLTWMTVEKRDGYTVSNWTSDSAGIRRRTPVARHSAGAMSAAHDHALDVMADFNNDVFAEAAAAA